MTDCKPTAPLSCARALGWFLIASALAAQAATGPAPADEADLKSAYCLPILTLNKATLEILEYADPALERGRQSAIRSAANAIRRVEHHLQARSSTVDQAALNRAADQGVADYQLMVAAAQACQDPCAPIVDRNALEAARCSVACQEAKEPAVARAKQCQRPDWLR